MLSGAMAAMMLPLASNAQRNDGFFNDYQTENRDWNPAYSFGFGLTTTEDPTAPVGSGLLIMLGAGAGYLIFKKKED